MVELVRQAVIWFVSSLVCAIGARCGRYLAERLTDTHKAHDASGDRRSGVLCPACGKAMRRHLNVLSCGACGHRES